MTENTTRVPEATIVPSSAAPPDEERIALGLADLARAAEELRRLGLDDVEPGLTFDAAWTSSEAAR
ncbi:MAG TPA: hypothetical protein VMP03_04910 [Methylomirabilota bacterium]|nr:hypothetical protein [Methylomirabilota bacterium]